MLILLPYFLPNVVAGHMWALMLDPRLGVINDVLVRHRLARQATRPGSPIPATAMAAAIVVEAWHSFPFFTLLIMAGLKGIPADLYKAADIDGAGAFAQLRLITLPMLKTIIAAAVILRVIGLVNSPDLLLILTAGRPRPLDAGAVALCVPDRLQGLQLRLCRRAVGGDVHPADGLCLTLHPALQSEPGLAPWPRPASGSKLIWDIAAYAVLILLAFICIFPLIWTFLTSIKVEADIVTRDDGLPPDALHLRLSYVKLWYQSGYPVLVINSLSSPASRC